MANEKRLCVICDLTSSIDKANGDRIKSVVNAKKIVLTKSLVGIYTQQLAQSQNITFQYSLELNKIYFNNQKYLYMDGYLYEIKTISPAKSSQCCKLNISLLEDNDIKNAIERWLTNDL